MIKFNFVEWHNFLATGSEPVRMELNQEHSTIIRGGNGAGKTTIVDALNYACFGKVLRDVTLSQLINTVNKKNMVVKVNFTVSGINYEVHRGQKPTVFKVFKDGDLLDQNAASKDLQAKLESEILKTNIKTFNQVVVIASTGYVPFMELDKASRRTVVEQMLDIEVIGQMSSVLKDRIKEVKINGSKLENDYNDTERSIQEIRNLISQAEQMGDKQVEQLDLRIDNIDKTLVGLNNDLAAVRNEHEVKTDHKPQVNKEIETDRFRMAKIELTSLDNLISEARTQIQSSRDSISTVNADVNNLNRSIAANTNTKSFYVDNDSCNVCKQVIDPDFKAEIVCNLEADIAISADAVSDKKKQSVLDNAIVNKKLNFITSNEELKRKQNAVIEEVNYMVQQLKDWKTACENIITKARAIQTRIADQVSVKNGLVNDKQDVLSRGNTDTKEFFNRINVFNETIQKLVSARAEIAEEQELCKLAEMMLKDNGLKAKIIKQFLPLINKTVNYNLEIMNANYSFVLDEEFNETIKSRYRDNFSYGSFSNGQRMRINLSLLLTWRKLAESKNTISSNLLILDEVLDGSLDKEGIDSLFNIFHDMSKSNLFVISHRPEIVDRFDKVINVSLKGNFSSYEM
jgi:DNA repair exonuclease SbcCD ATPase subunit